MAVGAMLAGLGLASAAWIAWGASWNLPRSRSAPAGYGYEAVAAWDEADIPSGELEHPIAVATGPDGSVHVLDNHARVVHFSAEGRFLEAWGKEGEGPGEFSRPMGIAVAPDGAVYVSDYDLDRVQKFSAHGRFTLAWGRSGAGPGEFDSPAGLAVDGEGFVYVADFYNHRVQQFNAQGILQRVFGRPGRLGDGALHYPTGVGIGPREVVVVADAYNYQLQWFDREGKALGRVGHHVFWLWPRPSTGRSGFHVPTGVAVGPAGLIHVADSGNHRIVMLSPRGAYLAAWTFPPVGSKIYSPEKVAVSSDGATLYAADLAGDRIQVLRVIRAGR